MEREGVTIKPVVVCIPHGNTMRKQEMYCWEFMGSQFGPFDTLIEALENCRNLSVAEIEKEAVQDIWKGSPAEMTLKDIEKNSINLWSRKKTSCKKGIEGVQTKNNKRRFNLDAVKSTL